MLYVVLPGCSSCSPYIKFVDTTFCLRHLFGIGARVLGLRPNKEHYMVPELSKDISDSRLMHDGRTNRCSDSAD